MRSIKFPKMFNSGSTRTWKESEHRKATSQNTRLVLLSERGELFGDPYFGLLIKHFTFDQNNSVLKEHLIDMIYTQLALFIPQIHIERKDIDIIQPKSEKGKVYCKIKGINQLDYQLDTIQLLLLDSEPESM